MNEQLVLPPQRDLPPGQLETRREHLLAEISCEANRRYRVFGGWQSRASRSPRRWRLAGVALVFGLVALALVATFGPSAPRTIPFAGTGTAQAAIQVRTVNGWYEIRITELAEGTEQVEQELQQLGLPVEFDFVPVSPSFEGTLVASSGGDGQERFLAPESVTGSTPAVRVPLDYDADLHLTIGRPGAAGETYVSSPALGAEAPGEVLHGSRIFNMPVGKALALLGQRVLTAEWRDENNEVRAADELLASYVSMAVPKAPGEVIIWTSPKPQLPDPRPEAVREALGY